MGTGLGTTQRAILDVLAEVSWSMSVVQLADQLKRSPAQIRRAVHALAERDLVVLTKGYSGHAGAGVYGPVMKRRDGVDLPTAEIRQEPYVYPTTDPNRAALLTVGWHDVEWVHRGMPTGVSLLVSLPEADDDWSNEDDSDL